MPTPKKDSPGGRDVDVNPTLGAPTHVGNWSHNRMGIGHLTDEHNPVRLVIRALFFEDRVRLRSRAL